MRNSKVALCFVTRTVDSEIQLLYFGTPTADSGTLTVLAITLIVQLVTLAIHFGVLATILKFCSVEVSAMKKEPLY